MSNAVATVAFLQGQAWAKAPDGSLRPLSVGSTLNADEVLVTAQGAQVQLDFGTGEPVLVNGGLEVAMSRDFSNDTATEPDEAALNDASVQEALTVLEQGGDLLDELEETAAGESGGGGADGSHDFVQLTRIVEQTDPQAFNYQSATASGAGVDQTDGNGVAYVNRAPQVTDQTLATNEDEPVTGQIIATDIEGDSITYTVTTPAGHGVVVIDPVTGQFTFTPAANYNGTDSFVVTVTDNRGNASTTTVSLNIAAVNDAPTTNDVNVTTDEDTPVVGQVVAQDIEGDTLTYTLSGQPTNGTVTLDPATGGFVYTPNANYNGSDSFIVTVSDGNGGTTTSTVRVGVTPVNDGPTSGDQNLVTNEDTPVSGQVVATDIDGDTLGYTVSGQPANGAVTINPITGGFVYTPNANYNGSDSFVVTISDGNGGTTTSRINIGVTPVNDAPTSNNQNLTTAEDTALSGQVVATDIEGDTLAYSVSGQPANGTVTLNPATGGFVYTPNANYNGSDSFVVTISDGNGGTTTSRINIGVTPVNDAPTSGNINLTTPEDTAISGQISASDIDGDSLSFSLGSGPANGTVTVSASGSFIYTPATGYNGSDSFVVSISDGNGGVTSSVVTIGVTPVNDIPVASNQNLTTNENVAINGAVSATDADGDTLTYNISTPPVNGSLVLNNATGTFTYTPNNGYSGSDSFVVTVSDGNGGTTTSTINIGVNAVNHAPTASDDNATTDESTAVTVAVRGNDTDPDGDSLTVTGVTQGANGSVIIDAATGNPVYTPNAGFTGTDSFTYSISDSRGGISSATVTVTVNPVLPPNNLPVAVADSITVVEGGSASTLTGGATSLLANDTDADGDPLAAVLVSGPANGSLVLNPNGTFNYIHNGSETTTDSFTYKVNDGTADGNTVTVNITVTPVNDAPVANDDFYTINEDQTLVIPLPMGALTLNDTDAEGDTLSVSNIFNVVNGSIAFVGGDFVFTPNANFSGAASFDYRVDDGKGGTATATVHISVVAVDDPTIVTPDTKTTAEDTSTTGNVLSNDSDADNTLQVVSYTVNGTTYSANSYAVIPGVGTFILISAGNYAFSPVANYNGSVPTVTYTTNTGASSTLDITVTPVNDAPVGNDDYVTINMNTSLTIDPAFLNTLLANDTDVDGDTLNVYNLGDTRNGSFTFVGASVIFTPTPGFSGLASFTYYINDGHNGLSEATVNVNVINQPSVLVADAVTINEESLVVGGVLNNDSDPDETLSVVSFTINGNTYAANTTAAIPSVGTLLLQADGGYLFTPVANYNGSVPTVTYTTNTGFSSTLNITVLPENDAPVANDDNFSVNSNTDLTIPEALLTGNDTDVDGDALTVVSVSGAVNGTVSLVAGVVTFTPTPGYSGSASFTYTVQDPSGASSTAVAHITVINQPSVLVADAVTINEESLVVGGVLNNDSDPDDALSVVSFTINGNTYAANTTASIPSVGTLLLQADGGYLFTPVANFNGSVPTVTYTTNTGSTSTLDITVIPENDAPVAVADNVSVLAGGTVSVLVGGNTSVLTNDSDVDGDTLSAILVSNPTHGTLTLNADGTFSYTHDGSATTSDSFSYKVNDGTVDGNTVTVTIGVTPVNHAPVAVADSISVAEGGTATVLVGGATSVLANDSDSDGNALSAILVTGPANGTLTLNANGTFSYVHNGSETTTDSFTYKVNDGTVDGNTVTVNITVNPVNDAPVSVADSIVVAEGGTVTTLVGGATSVLANDSDAENNSLTAVLVTGPAHGTLTLNANGTFTYIHDGSETTADSFTYRANDGTVNGNIVTVNINVTPVNDAPVAVADTITVLEGGTATLLVGGASSVLANDTDAEGNTLNAVLVTGPANGTLTLNANGTFSYVHNGSETTTDSFTYKVNDGTVDGNTVTVTINVTPVNDAPVAVADSFTVAEGGTLNGTSVLANDTDAEGNSLTAILVSGPAHGTLTLNANGTFTYIHDGSETTADSFSYKVNDGTVDGNTVVVSIGVTPVNDAPETNAASATGNEDSLVAVTLSGSDVDGSVVGYLVKTLPANGVLYHDAAKTLVISAGDLVSSPIYFMPNADWNGTTNFSFAARDNLGLEDPTPATATITINPLPDAAIIGGTSSGSVKEDTPAQTTASGSLTVTDPDAGEAAFTPKVNSPGAYGSFSIDAAGNWTYTLDNSKPSVQALKEGETRLDTFSVASIDGTSTTVTITVKGTNDGPVAAADTASLNQDATITLTPAQLLANDSDIDGDTLSIASVQGAVNGTVSLVGGNAVFTPNAGYHGPASFTYSVSDGQGGSSTATVNLTVIKANSVPDAVDDAAASSGGNLGLYSEYFGYREPADGANLTSIEQIYTFINGRTPNATFIAKSFDYTGGTFGDGLGNGTNLQTFLGSDAASLSTDPASTSDAIIRMRGFVNLDPGSYNFKVLADDGYQIRVDGVVVAEVNRIQSQTTATHAPFTIATGGLHHIEIIYWDQGGAAKLKLELSNDAGTTYNLLSSVPSYQHTTLSLVEDTALSIPAASLLANDTDADGDTLSIQSVQGAVNGTVSLVGGNVIFTPAANYNGPASFTYTISDGKGGTDTATVKLSVTPVNDAPVANNDTALTKQNTAISIPLSTLLANDTDVEKDYLSLVSVQGATNGSVAISGSNLIFTPTTNFEGVGSFTYTIRDPAGATSTATVNVTVGSATTPSMVVARALVANAHGTGGTSMKFPIITKLVDTDGSESLSIKVSNVPTNLSFNAGVNLGGGVWQFTEADLPNLVLNLPGSYTTNATHLTVQVTSTEINGGATASVSNVVTLKAAYTTVDITTTESGSYTGSSASEFIQGGNGNNTINASNGNNIVNGGGGDDNLSAGNGSDVISGGSGNDTIHAGSGADRISGGSGNDTLIGGDAGENFVDVFVWSLGDQGAAGAPMVDTIQNFATAAAGSNTTGGDVLDLRDLLQGESVGAANGAGNLADYLHFEVSGGNTIIHISHTGGFTADSHSVGGSYTSGAETQQIVLSGVNLQTLYSGATTDQQIITQLLNNNKLITD